MPALKMRKLGNNETQLHIDNDVVFFSYETPVAALIGGEYFKTDKKWSVTTSKHVNKWLNGVSATLKPQSFFDELANV